MNDEKNKWGYYPNEWEQLTATEQKIVILYRQYGIEKALDFRKWLAWPLEEPFNEKTYLSTWSRLKKKVQGFTKARGESTIVS